MHHYVSISTKTHTGVCMSQSTHQMRTNTLKTYLLKQSQTCIQLKILKQTTIEYTGNLWGHSKTRYLVDVAVKICALTTQFKNQKPFINNKMPNEFIRCTCCK